ncbi:MAG: T9SS type A sorting domain-containing protein [Bacteroidetes bacterium]|nr:T9SS type A sorting domain-containing protein [Bacteroidota bacterium]MBL6942784.1 T9SS type A sorting domain-containing protein [Bacteroidales bacterium]
MTTHVKLLIVFITVLLSVHSLANIVTVKQDGTGDYTIIQNAVNAAVDGDTVLVWPGTYYENVNFIGKNITLGSLMLTTGDENYKYITIIDGYNNGSCIMFKAGETDAILFGFTLQHGSGYLDLPFNETYGGGVFIDHSSASIYNCVIKENKSSLQSGGVHCDQYSNLFISGTSIFGNQSYSIGGLYYGYESVVTFDSINKCSIYNNYAGIACDIAHRNMNITMNIVLDTFSVLVPTPYFISSTDINAYEIGNYTYSIDHAFIDPIDSDIYVNPLTGDNTNSGLTSGNPLKTIAFALSSIAIDSVDKNTIHLANGYYSDSTNGERFLLNIRPYVDIVGESRDGVILDGRHLTNIIKGNPEVSDYSFKNMTMKRGGFVRADGWQIATAFGYLYQQNDNIVFDSVVFTHGWSAYAGTLYPIRCNNVTIKNCEFRNTIGGEALRLDSTEDDTMYVYNCKFVDNMPDYNNPEYFIGRALAISGEESVKVVANSLFTGNNQQTIGTVGSDNLYLINCTFTESTLLTNTAASILSVDASLYMYNCISYNEGNQPLSLTYNETLDTVFMEIYNSLIEGGEESIYVEPGLTRLHYDETNIDADPLFYGGWEYPYNLSDNSPCIDAGTLDLPDWIELPEFDLAGNLRVYNGAIDMGAYEWDPTVGVPEHKPVVEEKEKLLKAAPNPFSGSTTITAVFKTKANIKLEVYNNNGQRVRVLMDGTTLPGISQIIWYGDDDNKQPLPAGIYYVVMFVDGKEVESLKLVKCDN